MALWTPYKEEVALDLSKKTVKVERRSPITVTSASQYPANQNVRVYCTPQTNTQHYTMFQPMDTHMCPQQYSVPERTYTPLYSEQLYTEMQQQNKYLQEPVICYEVPSTSPDSAESASRSNKLSSPQLYDDSFETESLSEDPEYVAFERDAFQALAAKNGGTLFGHNPRMRRAVQNSQVTDDSYRQQRIRNNCAAKQSRDRRKLKELRLAFQVSFLKKKIKEIRASTGLCSRCRRF